MVSLDSDLMCHGQKPSSNQMKHNRFSKDAVMNIEVDMAASDCVSLSRVGERWSERESASQRESKRSPHDTMTRAAAAAATAAGGSCTVQSLSWTVEVPVGRCFLVSALFCRLFRPRTKSRTALKSRPASCTTHHHITIMSQSLGVDSTHHGPRPINLYNSSKYKLPKLAWRDLNTRIQL